uniref:Uncharacterized protein n=1 Tax=Candidatus Kentrum sp. FM TaxID=2126340 RepID=A0A450VNU7_9GAMM|nr:MAG: hypothetical protein BECKFM1743A_GA0114220_1001610 [Candidatus Kentron sp. FM]VFJ63602.1 MAG: hypothetical protein BECKFM1743C_GA0114222_103492 [Candidatus Kentron sp. FM]VFK06496.1 MAG: hypothetical protein BECKFM1743B_GA0114221_1001811 [Candidatus Kentron sp. FM]
MISIKEYTSLLVLLPSLGVAMTVTSWLCAHHCALNPNKGFRWAYQGCSVLLAKARNYAVRLGVSRKKRPMPAWRPALPGRTEQPWWAYPPLGGGEKCPRHFIYERHGKTRIFPSGLQSACTILGPKTREAWWIMIQRGPQAKPKHRCIPRARRWAEKHGGPATIEEPFAHGVWRFDFTHREFVNYHSYFLWWTLVRRPPNCPPAYTRTGDFQPMTIIFLLVTHLLAT